MKKTLYFLFIFSITYTLNAQRAYQPEFGNKDFPAVIKKAHKALKINPTDSIAHYVLGLSHTQLKNHKKAIKNLELAKNNGLNFFNVQLNLAKNYAQLNQNEKAISELEAASKTGRLLYAQMGSPEFRTLESTEKFKEIKKSVYASTFPCKSDKNYRRFDFWEGDWEVYAAGGKGPKIADSTISLTNGDCGILENYRPLGGRAGGHSISYYDSADKKWKQNWVAGGSVNHYIEPKHTKGDLQLQTQFVNPQGKNIILRMTFFNNEDGTVKQIQERSIDNEKTWTLTYNGLYKKKNSE